ncbi:hypothetical protein Tco_0457602 [Tanacetum coccineum]
MEKRNIQDRNVPSRNHHRAFRNELESFKAPISSFATRIPGFTTLSSFLDENESKVSITGKGGSRMNEIENLSGDRNLLD